MKKYVIIASAILTLAGCSASMAHAEVATPHVTQQTTSPMSFQQVLKAQRDGIHMKAVVKYLFSRVGRTSYVFSGASPYGWDCSGLVRWTYEQFGLELPHSADAQGHLGKRVHTPKLGDIVVFAYNGSTTFYHAAIYIGKNKIINANSGYGTTMIEPLSDFKTNQIRFIRVLPTL